MTAMKKKEDRSKFSSKRPKLLRIKPHSLLRSWTMTWPHKKRWWNYWCSKLEVINRPVPKEAGTVLCTIKRDKTGFNRWHPRYELMLSVREVWLARVPSASWWMERKDLITVLQTIWSQLKPRNLKRSSRVHLGSSDQISLVPSSRYLTQERILRRKWPLIRSANSWE